MLFFQICLLIEGTKGLNKIYVPQNEDINRVGSVPQYSGVVSVAILGPGTRSSKVLGLERMEQAGFRTCFKEGCWVFFNFISSSTFHVVIKREAVPHLNLIILLLFFKELEFIFIYPVLF